MSLLAVLVAVLVAGCAAQRAGVPRADSPGVTIPMEITRPDGAGPFPAVVWLHGCNGVHRSAHAQVEALFSAHLARRP